MPGFTNLRLCLRLPGTVRDYFAMLGISDISVAYPHLKRISIVIDFQLQGAMRDNFMIEIQVKAFQKNKNLNPFSHFIILLYTYSSEVSLRPCVIMRYAIRRIFLSRATSKHGS